MIRTPVLERLGVTEVTSELVAVLGAPTVAILGDVQDTRSVRAWAKGEYPPDKEDNLRFALQVVYILQVREGPGTIRAWFAGMNDLLEDENPALLIGAGPDADTKKRILRAARHFVAM